jgi:GDSL-like Lipase/Acylhydrolase family
MAVKRAVALLGVVAVVSGVVALGVRTPPAAGAPGPGSVQVFFGYADRLHSQPPPGAFPTPWAGSPKTIFEGCLPVTKCDFDGTAVDVKNNTAANVTVTNVTVHIGACTYTGWPAATLPPGNRLIAAQLLSGGNDGCTGPTPNSIDSSDIGPGGAPYAGNCAKDGIVPTVDVTVNGQSTTYIDSAQILNTGGFDSGACPRGTNESEPWTAPGTYVALGDSYSSGEGVAPYFGNTDSTGVNECHDSTRAYPVRVARFLRFYPHHTGQFGFEACSGAAVPDVWGTSGPGTGVVGGQGQWNATTPQIVHVDARDSLVTISIGGNDVGFSAVASNCFSSLVGAGDCPGANYFNMISRLTTGGLEYMTRAADGTVTGPIACGDVGMPACPPANPTGNPATFVITAPSLRKLYDQIALQAPSAHIRVVLYPPLVPPTPIGTSGFCRGLLPNGIGVPAGLISTFTLLLGNLNSTISTAVTGAQVDNPGRDIQAVDPVTAFSVPRSGSDNGWFCNRNNGFITTFYSADPMFFRIFLSGLTPEVQSLHPNNRGQAALANAVNGSF